MANVVAKKRSLSNFIAKNVGDVVTHMFRANTICFKIDDFHIQSRLYDV